MPTITILPTAQAAESYDFSSSIAVVIDVLRATSVMTMALHNGAARAIAVTSIDEAFSLRKKLAPEETILGGERNADRIEGFDLGNSPSDYTRDVVDGKTVILTTTNGTLALNNSQRAHSIFVVSLLNCQSSARAIASSDKTQCQNIAIVCSGNYGKFTLEDCLCAGLLSKYLEQTAGPIDYADDFSIGIRMMADAYQVNSTDYFKQAVHYNKLMSKGYDADLNLCLCHVNDIDSVCCAKADNNLGAVVISKK